MKSVYNHLPDNRRYNGLGSIAYDFHMESWFMTQVLSSGVMAVKLFSLDQPEIFCEIIAILQSVGANNRQIKSITAC